MKAKITTVLFLLILIILIPINIQATNLFDKNITFETHAYDKQGDIMSYGEMIPSNASECSSLPLIVWLHGSGEVGGAKEQCIGTYNGNLFPRVINDSTLNKFSAYILLPHLSSGRWHNDTALKNVSTLIEYFINEKGNVDTDNIIIAGHSLGAMGAQYMARNMDKMSYKFSKLVIISGYTTNNTNNGSLDKITIPAIGYFGTGEDYSYTSKIPTLEKIIQLKTTHPYTPGGAYNIDEDGNMCSDLIEWMFEGVTIGSDSTDNNISKKDNDTDDETDGGGKLLEGIAKFMCFVPDNVIEFLQHKLISEKDIKIGQNEGYKFLYSPAVIFSGTVPAFDIDFIKADSQETYVDYITNIVSKNYEEAKKLNNTDDTEYKNAQTQSNYSHFAIDKTLIKKPDVGAISEDPGLTDLHGTINVYYFIDKENGQIRIECEYPKAKGTIYQGLGDPFYYSMTIPLDDATMDTVQYPSTASILQNTISTWYNALRKIALIGLLSVLVYIGIKIVLTSTSAKEKAKYKNMLKDWLVALCILFTLHYIMSITITVVNSISDVFNASILGEDGEDILLTTLRNEIAAGEKWKNVIVQVVIYFVLGVYTIIFTIQYFKRAIYIAFLTMIAPLITLTYPLDKIKDSKSQAFDMWLKDYVFFSLLQVIHLLIYYILLGSSIDLSDSGNWMLALVTIGFLVPAEKIVKKMFGFNKSKTMSSLSAGATGALVINAVKKMGSMAGKGNKGGSSPEGKEGESKGNKVRTAGNNPLSALQGNQGTSGEKEKTPKEKALAGAKSIAGTYGKKAGQTAVKYGGALTGAMLGVAGGIAQGDIGAALTGGATGFGAGKSIGDRISRGVDTKGVRNAIDGVKDTWNKGVHGAEFAESASSAREFKRTSAYKGLKDKFGDDLTDENLRAMLSADINDEKTMTKILESGDVGQGIGYYTLAKECPDSIYYDTNLLKNYVTDLVEREGLVQSDADEIIKNMKKYR